MAVSLVSTGVQFPDSTIQTTAVSGTPSMSANGSTIITQTNTNLWAYGSNTGTYTGTTNITTTAPATIWQSPEVRANMWYSPGGSASMVSRSGDGWNATGDYSSGWPRLLYDYYTNRFVATLYVTSGGSNSIMNWYSDDGCSTWYPFLNSNFQQSSYLWLPSFNPYTGARVSTRSNYASSELNTYSAANAYNMDASASQSSSTVGQAGPPSFIDTGTQSTSKFFVMGRDSGASQGYMYSRTANNDSGTWTDYYFGNKNQMSRVIGMPVEIMCCSYNNGICYSTDMGGGWNFYNFGSNVIGTSSDKFYKHMAWNGSYWLGTTNTNNYRLVTKVMGSGTSWTELTNLSTPGITDWAGVAWNPTLACWIIIKYNGAVYTNTSSNPNSGTWTLIRTLPFFSYSSSLSTFAPMYVKAVSTFNY